jgi:hypothetical protein
MNNRIFCKEFVNCESLGLRELQLQFETLT